MSHYLMLTLGEFRRNPQTQPDNVVKQTPKCVFWMFSFHYSLTEDLLWKQQLNSTQ